MSEEGWRVGLGGMFVSIFSFIICVIHKDPACVII